MLKEKTRTVPGLLNVASKALGGTAEIGDDVGLKQNTTEAVGFDRDELLRTRDQYEEARAELSARKRALKEIALAARIFCLLARDMLKPRLGSQYSEAWDATGLVGSLQVSSDPNELSPLLLSFRAYFTLLPAVEVSQLNLTAADADQMYTKLAAAQVAVGMQESRVLDALQARDEAARKLRRRLRGLVHELEQLIEPLDGRWRAFGFPLPGATASPEVPENLEVTPVTETSVQLTWKAAPRAEYYRVWQRVVGTEEFVAIENRYSTEFTVEDLSPEVKMEFAVSAVNEGGESARRELQSAN